MTKITKGVLSLEQANAICPEYVNFVHDHDYAYLEAVLGQFEKVRVGDVCITAVRQDLKDGPLVFVRGKITSVNNDDWRAIDGPIVRFGNGQYTWRVDGSKYAWLIESAADRAADKAVKEVVEEAMAGA